MDRETAIKKYPRLVAHMICQSLGYFSPKSTAGALAACINKKPYYCEWYCHMAQFRNDERNLFHEDSVMAVTRDVPDWAFRNRHTHKEYMAEYQHAKAIVNLYIKSKHSPNFGLASWF